MDELLNRDRGNPPFVDIMHLSPPCQPFSPAHTIASPERDEINEAAMFSACHLLEVVRPSQMLKSPFRNSILWLPTSLPLLPTLSLVPFTPIPTSLPAQPPPPPVRSLCSTLAIQPSTQEVRSSSPLPSAAVLTTRTSRDGYTSRLYIAPTTGLWTFPLHKILSRV